MTTINAQGTATSHHIAERATLRIAVSHISEDRQRSIERATELHNLIFTQAQSLRAEGHATWHHADPIRTYGYTKTRKDSDETYTEYVTQSAVHIKLSDLDIVSELTTALAELGAYVTVAWALTENSKREKERATRKQAVKVARAIAEDYAEALGLSIRHVESISDVQTAPDGSHVRAAAASGKPSASASITIPEITVSATVEGVFLAE